MAGFDDIVGKANAFLQDEKVQSKLRSPQAEEVSDKILNAAEDAVNKVTGNRFSEQIASAKNAADRAVGTKEADAPAAGAKVVEGEATGAGSSLNRDPAPSTTMDGDK